MYSDLSVAVIVTCYNQERYIEQALDSLVAQTVPPKQVIVVDGYSSDRSVRVVKDWIQENPGFPVTFIEHDKNYGLNATLNQAMSIVSSRFVLTLYGDDWLEPDRIAHQAPLLAASSDEVCMLVGSMREVDKRGNAIVDHDFTDRIRPLLEMAPLERLETLIKQNVIPSPAVMLKVDAVLAIGGYDESLTFDDYDLWMRLLSKHRLEFDPAVVVNYRVLLDSLSRNADRKGDFLLSEAKMVHKYAKQNARLDHLIEKRVRANAQALLEIQDIDRLLVALNLLKDVTSDPEIDSAIKKLSSPKCLSSALEFNFVGLQNG